MKLKKNIYLILAIAIIFKPSLGLTQSNSDKQSPIVVGQISQPVESDIKYEWAPKEQVNLGNIIAKNDKLELQIVAIGGRFAAGYQNGGLYRKSQQIAYPNLVAIQMGIKKFSSPVFNLNQGNGTGYKILKEAKPYPELLEVTNNLGYSDHNKTTLNIYTGEISNYAIPNVNFSLLAKSLNEMTSTNDPHRSNFLRFSNRILKEDNNILKISTETNADFAILEFGIEDFIIELTEGRNVTVESIIAREVRYELDIIKKFANKSVIVNIPDLLDFPFFHFYPYHNLSNLYGDDKIYSHFFNINTTVITPNALFLPTENTNLLFRKLSDKGLSFTNPLDDGDVLTEEELIHPDNYNRMLEKVAKSNNVPIVDLEAV